MREMAGDAEGVGPVGFFFVPCPHLSAPYGPVAGADVLYFCQKDETGIGPKTSKKGRGLSTLQKSGMEGGFGWG